MTWAVLRITSSSAPLLILSLLVQPHPTSGMRPLSMSHDSIHDMAPWRANSSKVP